MAKAKFDIPSQLPASISRPLYAGVGVTDRVVGAVRETVADVQKRAVAVGLDVTKTVAGLDYQPQALRRQATQAAGDTLDLLVKRGETLVGRIRRQPSTTATVDAAQTTSAKAKTTRTQAAKTARKTTKKAAKSPARSSAKATTTAAKKTASSAARATVDATKKVGD
jgi:heparin binding hemagglutinin HbhA